ncbi:prepilin peptidase [Candidatus Micrarchaeota archaeon]|nr:prepilin peptidase [Candidatus Micrarchaeota archaeon]
MVVFDFILARVVVSVLVAAYLAWEDAKTSFMNERLLLVFVASGAFVDLVFLPQDSWLVVFGVAAAIAAIGFISYKAGQFGGGDVLILLGLHLWLPFSPFVAVPWPFILSVFVASAAMGSIASAVLYAWKLRKEKLPKRKRLLFGLLVVLSLAFLLLPFGLFGVLFYALAVSSSFYFVFRGELLEKVIIQQVKLKDIEDEDVLAMEQIAQSKVKRFSLEKVLTASALQKLKKYARSSRKTTVPIYKNLPRFGPYILAGLLACLAVGDVIWFLMGL